MSTPPVVPDVSTVSDVPDVTAVLMVKDEAAIIERILTNALEYAARVVVSDTGSSDDTLDLLAQFASVHPGVLYVFSDPWSDFATNRNLVLDHARGLSPNGWLLVLDADDVISGTLDDLSSAEAARADAVDAVDAVMVTRLHYTGTVSWQAPLLIRSTSQAFYEGVVHEYLAGVAQTYTAPSPPGPSLVLQSTPDGHRSQQPPYLKYSRDAQVLEQALQDAPAHLVPRYTFYLAQSYRDSGQYDKAREHYLARSRDTSGYELERQDALLNLARLTPNSPSKWAAYQTAIAANPSWPDPVMEFAEHLVSIGSPELVPHLLTTVETRTVPGTGLFPSTNIDVRIKRLRQRFAALQD